MKLKLNTRTLRERFATAAAVVNARPARPICRNVLIDFATGECIGTDLERWITAHDEALKVGGGTLLLPADRGAKMLQAIRSEEVQIDTGDGKARISGGGVEFKLTTESAGEFPRAQQAKNVTCSVVLNAATIVEAFARTRFCADVSSTRYALGGVNIDASKTLRFCASDGNALSLFNVAIKSAARASAIVPMASVAVISRVLQSVVGDVTLGIEYNAITVSGAGVSIRSPLVEGRFPRVEDVIPPDETRHVETLAENLLQAIDAASLVCVRDEDGEQFNSCEFSARPGSLVIRASAAEVGSSEIEMPCTCEHFQPVTLNTGFIRPWLQAIGRTAAVEIEFRADGSPATFRSGDAKLIVMPIATEA